MRINRTLTPEELKAFVITGRTEARFKRRIGRMIEKELSDIVKNAKIDLVEDKTITDIQSMKEG